MRASSRFRAALIAVIALVVTGLSSAAPTPALADGGTISFSVFKGGWFVGASAGQGVVRFHGQIYPISIGGVSAGLVFGGSQTTFHGTVSNIRSPYDVAGVYAAVGAGGAVGIGAQVITLQNEKGAILTLSGRQIGLQVNLDLSGLSISLK
jgi:peptidoglycan/LPS O-acetylase OafA/YrhL